MKRIVYFLALLCVVGAVSGCAITGGSSAAGGRRAFASLQAAVAEAAEPARDTVVLIKLKGPSLGSSRSLVMSAGGSLRQAQQSGAKTVAGLILSADGYVVISEAVQPSDVVRAEAWIGDNEYRARVLKSDNQLGMTVLKMEVDEPVKVLNLDKAEDLKPGEWCIGVQPSDEEFDYEQFTSVAVCRGQKPGLYREFILDNADSLRPGSPVLSLSGNVVGISKGRGRVLAMSDIRDDLLALLEDAAGVKSADEEAKQKAWFGAILMPVNRDYARKNDLSRSCLWVSHVIKEGPADAAGVRGGDLITRVNGSDMRLTGQGAHDFFMKALRPKVGNPFTITVLREGDVVELEGVFVKEPEEETVMAADLGVTVRRIDDGVMVRRNLFTGEGVLVVDVKRGSAASVGSNMRSALLSQGDVITAIDGTPTPDLATFSTVLEQLRRENREILLVEYRRGRVTGFAALNLKIGEKDSEGGKQ